MRKYVWIVLLSAVGLVAFLQATRADLQNEDHEQWTAEFPIDRSALSATGENLYLSLIPGHQLVIEDAEEQVTITVLDETEIVDGVETRVVEEREVKEGKLVEVARNYLAICNKTNSVYYFGEDVDWYKDDKVIGHEGSWHAGTNGAKFGLIMPGLPLLGSRHYHEQVPGEAMDRGEIVSLNETIETPAGTFKNCLKVEETNPLEPDSKEYKYYAPGIGHVQADDMKLVSYKKAEQETIASKPKPETR